MIAVKRGTNRYIEMHSERKRNGRNAMEDNEKERNKMDN
jgi:hypothetical protein